MGSVCSQSQNNFKPTSQQIQAMAQARNQYPMNKYKLQEINKKPINEQKKIIENLQRKYVHYSQGSHYYSDYETEDKMKFYKKMHKKKEKLQKEWNKAKKNEEKASRKAVVAADQGDDRESRLNISRVLESTNPEKQQYIERIPQLAGKLQKKSKKIIKKTRLNA